MPSRAVSEPLLGSQPHPAIRLALVAVAGSALVAVAAHVSIPFWPVPLTLQTWAVLMIRAICGPQRAFGVMLAHLTEGLVGWPVFAAAGGPTVLSGPTGGYLLGMVGAAGLGGLASRRGWLATPLKALVAFSAVDAVIFVSGLTRLVGPLGFERAIDVGLRPFLVGEVLKLALAVTLVTALRRKRVALR